MTSATERWQDALAGWAIPTEILEAAPESPWGFPVEMFGAHQSDPSSMSRMRALQVLPDGGSVLDVGCGGGAASLALVPPAARVTGVDSAAHMLQAYADAMAAAGVDHTKVEGQWPDVAAAVAVHDVVACHHVFYNVAELAPFAHALTARAARRVVVEMTALHPLVSLAPLWRHFHGLERPDGPSAELAIALLAESGIEASSEHWQRPPRDVPHDVLVAFTRRRLCLPVSAEPEVERLMGQQLSRDVVTLWWDAD